MNILFISRAYSQHAGGMERLSFELIREFQKRELVAPLSPIGERARVRATQAKLLWQVITIVNATKQDFSLLSTRLHTIVFAISILPKALVASRHVDIVHIGDPVLSFVGWCIAKFRQIPVVVTVHGLDILYPNPLYQLYLKLFFRNFTHYIAISEYAKKLLRKQGVHKNVTVIPPGITDTSILHTYTRNDLGKLLYRNVSHRTVFATTGRLVARKGHAWFIKDVMTRLPRTALYAIAGDGPEREHIAALIKSLKLEDRIIMLGRISEEDKKILLQTIDAFIQPNISIQGDAEGFGIAPIEAALHGRAVFASNVDGIPSAIHDKKNGTLLPPKETTAWVNALTTFMQHPISYEPSGKDARIYTKKTFAWEKIAEQYRQVFEALLNK